MIALSVAILVAFVVIGLSAGAMKKINDEINKEL